MSSTLFTGNFPELQARFIEQVRANRKRDPLSELTVLVTGQLVRVSLRRELVRAGCPHANLRFLTVNDLVHRFAAPVIAERGLTLLGDVPRDLLMKHAVEAVIDKLRYFRRIAPYRGFRTKLLSTLHDLRYAGVTIPALREAADLLDLKTVGAPHAAPKNSAPTPQKLRELSLLWESYRSILSEHRLLDRGAALELAIENLRANGGLDHPVILYGLDELSELERRFLYHAFRGTDATAYLPYRETRAYEFTKPLLKWYDASGFKQTPLDPDLEQSKQQLSRVQRGIFEIEITPAEQEPDPGDGSLSVIAAPDSGSEADEITREVLFPAMKSDSASRTAVLMRSARPHTDLLRVSMNRVGIEAYYHECRTLGETPPSAALRRLTKLLDGRYRRADVEEFLLSSPLAALELDDGESKEIPASEWSRFTLEAGITEGENHWNESLTRLANRLRPSLDRRDPEDSPDAMLINRLHSLENFREYFSRLTVGVNRIQTALSWKEAVERLWTLFAQLVEFDKETEGILEQLNLLVALDSAGGKPTPDELRAAVETALRTPAKREGRFQENDPTVATTQQARGVLFDDVLVMGMNAGVFPRAESQDPLLLDSERKALSHVLNSANRKVHLPLTSEWIQRERYRFALLLSSAKRRVVLSFSSGGAATVDRSASSFLLEVMSNLFGAAANAEMLEGFIRENHFSRDHAHRADADRITTEYDYDAASLARAFDVNNPAPLAHLQAHDIFLEAVSAERHRFHIPVFRDYDGVLGAEAKSDEFAEWVGNQLHTVDATALEMYWDCPFRWLGVRLLELGEVDEVQRLQTIDAKNRGSLIHKILERFCRREFASGKVTDHSEADASRLVSFAEQQLADYERSFPTGPLMLWRHEKRKIMRMLEQFFLYDVAHRNGFIPRHFELAFGMDASTPAVEYAPDGEHPINLRGKIDRVDAQADGRLRVLDYKSGRRKPGYKQGELLASRMLQLHLYRIAAESLLDGTVAEASYYYLKEAGAKARATLHDSDWDRDRQEFNRILEILLFSIRAGRFHPYPDSDVCRYCDVREACGAGRLTHKWPLPENQSDYRSIREPGA